MIVSVVCVRVRERVRVVDGTLGAREMDERASGDGDGDKVR